MVSNISNMRGKERLGREHEFDYSREFQKPASNGRIMPPFVPTSEEDSWFLRSRLEGIR